MTPYHAIGSEEFLDSAHDSIAPARAAVRRPLRILLAEDGLVNQRIALGMLKQRGHDVTVANDGVEVVELVSTNEFDLILMDVQMPRMDGIAAARAVRKLQSGTGIHTPIIAMTASTTQDDRDCCMRSGMDGYVAKPLNTAKLEDIFERVVSPADAMATYSNDPIIEVPDDVPLFDFERARARFRNDLGAIREILTLFQEQARLLAAAIDSAVCNNAAKEVELAAHTLRGSADAIGAGRLASAARRIELLAKQQEFNEVDTAIDDLKSELEQLLPLLQEYTRSANC